MNNNLFVNYDLMVYIFNMCDVHTTLPIIMCVDHHFRRIIVQKTLYADYKACRYDIAINKMKWGYDNKNTSNDSLFKTAVSYGRLDYAKWLFDNRIIDRKYMIPAAFMSACCRNQLATMIWLYDTIKNYHIDTTGFKRTVYTFLEQCFQLCISDKTTDSGRKLDSVKWLMTIINISSINKLFDACIEHGEFDIASWVVEFSNQHSIILINDNIYARYSWFDHDKRIYNFLNDLVHKN